VARSLSAGSPLTGPSSATAIGFDRGVKFAADEINTAGGVKGRRIEIVTRDTQGDPTKAVNATQDMIARQKVSAIWGPTNSGEALATNAVMARAKMPNIHPVSSTASSIRRSIRTRFASPPPTASGMTRCATIAKTF
jgi:ABC-type branched-subunit amino acid transport system substrate-binding protein